MMKNMKKYLLIAFAAIASFTACDFLDRGPLSDMTEEIYFRTAEDFQLFTNPLYNNLLDKHPYNHQSDHYIKLSLSNLIHGGSYRTVPASGGGWTWTDLRRINTVLSRMDTCEDEKVKAEYEALARFFRAFFYYEKVKLFGDVPWIEEELASDSEKLQAPRDSREFIMQKMLADIDFAIENLPATVSTFRVNRWAALALKSQFCLFEGTFRKYHSLTIDPAKAGVETVNDYQFYLEAAAAAAEEIINDGPYKLYSTGKPDQDYRMLFAQEDASKAEFILAVYYNHPAGIYNNSTAMSLLPAQGRLSATRKFVNTYLMADGSRFTDKPDHKTMEYFDEFQNRDPRLAQTLRAPGYTRLYGNSASDDCPTCGQPVHSTKATVVENGPAVLAPDLSCTCTGYHIAKWTMAADANAGDSDRADRSSNDTPVYRYAEVLLNYAEAKAELGQFDQTVADKTINLLRERVGMAKMNVGSLTVDPYLTDPKTGYTNPILLASPNLAQILEIRRERGVELAQEGDFRWEGLLRWKEGKCIEQDMHGIYFPGPGQYDLDRNGTIDAWLYGANEAQPTIDTSNEEYAACVLLKIGTDIFLSGGNSGYVDPQQKSEHTFNEARDYFYPIPIDERSLNPNLTQNPGWDDGLDF